MENAALVYTPINIYYYNALTSTKSNNFETTNFKEEKKNVWKS